METGKLILRYMNQNGISKLSISSKMGISTYKLDRILNTPDSVLSCITYRNLVVALGIPADFFFKEKDRMNREIKELINLFNKSDDSTKARVLSILINGQVE